MSSSAPLLAYRPDLDGLRAVAVLGVVVFHAVPLLAPGGYVGVDVFFVISGYLITILSHRRMQRGGFSFIDFYARRARRLLPALFTVVLASLLVGSQLYGLREQAALGKSSAAAALFGANIHYYFGVDYFQVDLDTLPLLHLWSLGVEEQFYLVAPVALMLLYRRPRLLWRSAVAMVFVSFVACVIMTWVNGRAAFFLPMYRAWELGLGALLALRSPEIRSPRLRAGLGMGGLLAIAAGVFLLDDHIPFPGVAALLPTLGTLALLAAGPTSPANRLLSVAPLRAIGRWSYAWYLWHYPFLIFATFLLMRPPTVVEALGLGLSSLALSAASTRWLESPLRTWRVDSPRAAVGRGLLASLVLACFGGVYVLAYDPIDTVVSAEELRVLMHSPESGCEGMTTAGLDLLTCAMGSPEASLDVFLWGDSHAAALAKGLEEVLEESDRNGLAVTRNGCPPLLGVDLADRPRESCLGHNNEVLAYIEQQQPKVVALHARWPLYVEGKQFANMNHKTPVLTWEGSRSRPADLPLALEQTVVRLQESGAAVFLVGSIPEARFSIPLALQRAEQLGRALPIGTTREDFEARRARSKSMLEAVAERTGARLLQPAALLCTSEHCTITVEETPLYLDDNHLSPEGARLIKPSLLPIVP